MDETGRIRRPLAWRAREIVFGSDSDRAIDEELPYYVQIDRAHVVMLHETGLLSANAARQLLGAITDLVAVDYAPLRGRPAPRGMYLLYERYLSDTLGEEVGGAVHLGRSRNDLNATVLHLRLRRHHSRLAREVLRLLAVLIRRAKRHATLTMPVYTHYQAALPVTYGHYLSGIALALERDLQGLAAIGPQLGRCPLGAGAAGGTSVPIDPERTARLLGFEKGVLHSVDAVASRDVVLRLLGAATTLGVTLSRLATDLQVWSTAEFDLVRWPDRLVGSSSMMPQKRNPFLLEHIKGRSAAPMGALASAVLAMHGTPFSNSVAVGTEAVKPVWTALDELTSAVILARLMVCGAEPQPATMYRRSVEAYTPATELANRLVLATGISFRRAHRLVGEQVLRSSEDGTPLSVAADRLYREHGSAVDPAWLDPGVVVAATAYGGGPAAGSLGCIQTELRRRWAAGVRRLRKQAHGWRAGERALERAARRILHGDDERAPARAPELDRARA